VWTRGTDPLRPRHGRLALALLEQSVAVELAGDGAEIGRRSLVDGLGDHRLLEGGRDSGRHRIVRKGVETREERVDVEELGRLGRQAAPAEQPAGSEKPTPRGRPGGEKGVGRPAAACPHLRHPASSPYSLSPLLAFP